MSSPLIVYGSSVDRDRVEVLDRDELAADLALECGAVADEDDVLALLHVERPLVVAEHDVQARQLLVELLVHQAQDLDRLFDRARAAAPAVVLALALGRRPGVSGDLRAFEVLLDSHQADLESPSPAPCACASVTSP